MNLFKEMRAFYDYVLLNGVSTGEVALWYTLISVNNRLGWLDEFAVSNLILQQATSLSRNGLNSARNGLKQKGLIDYCPGKSNQAGKYRMVSLECNILGTPECTKPDELVTENDTSSVHTEGTLTRHKLKHKNPSISPQGESGGRKQKKTIAQLCDEYAADGPIREALDGFIEMRQQRKYGITARALQLTFRELDKLSAEYGDRAGEAKAAILDQSTQRGWRGVFALTEPLPEQQPVIHKEQPARAPTAEEIQTLSLQELLG